MEAVPQDKRLLLPFCMHPLTPDERSTCESMLQLNDQSRVLVMPTHHISDLGDMMGFRSVPTPSLSRPRTLCFPK